MCSLDWVYIDLKIKNPRKHILFNKNEIFVICDFVIWFCGQVYSFTKRTLSPLSAWPQRLRRRSLPDCTYCMSFQTRRPYFLYETMEIKACAHNSPMPEWLFVSFGRTESLKLQQPKIQKPLHSPRSEEVKDEESKQLATSCLKSLHYATLPLSCVFPSICELWMRMRGSTGMCDFLGETLVRVDFQHPFHFEKFVSKNQQFPSIILKLNIRTCKWMKTRGLGDGERTAYYSQSVVNKVTAHT